MNQLSTIKERLKNFNETEFQELCDSFLSLRNHDYKAYSRTGAHDIKQKTTRGRPDSFIQMLNGRYLFIESTTTEHKGKKLIDKLKKDISDCLDFENTKIPKDKIQDIILCYNSNLKPAEIEEVNKEAVEISGTVPGHYNLERLATEIFFHHKNLAKDYLGIPLDTGQIVSLEKFVEEYDNGKQKLATPLAGVFLHRDVELKNVRDKLVDNDIVIISGPAGVGKTKLALQSIYKFIESHLDYNGFAISPKGADLIGDLGAYFEGDDNSILLVDDVNRVDKFDQILSFYRSLNRGKLKLILTVRDYALDNVRDWMSGYKNSIVKISGFDYEEIKAIIEQEPFEVRHGKYQLKIYDIAKGNARLAVMMAIIARETNKLESLNNVTDLFEQYFETFISDENAFKNKRVLKALGIISFFYTLPYDDIELLNSVAISFSISSDELRDAFDTLHSLDLVELNYEHVRIGEQNLSTYFFYKVFIKDKLLSFASLWNNYFDQLEYRFKDTVYPMYQNFGKEAIIKEIKPTLSSYWSTIKLDEKKAFRFYNFAWEFLPDDCIIYIEERISLLDTVTADELITKYVTNDFANTHKREKHLDLLSYFFKSPIFFLDALELSFQFVKKKQKHLPQLIYHIDQNTYFLDEDYINHFERYTILVDYLIEESGQGRQEALSFFVISSQLLKQLRWSYISKKESEKDDSNIASVQLSRGKILYTLCNLYNDYPNEVFEVMLNFSMTYEKDSKYTFDFDLDYLVPWIDSNLNNKSFHHCYYVREMIRSSRKVKHSYPDLKRLKSTFRHPTYSLFELVNWDRRRGKEDYDFEDYREFDELKKSDIAKKLAFKTKRDINQFISQYREILEWNQIKLYSQFNVCEAIIKANLINDIDIGFETFIAFVKLRDEEIFNSDISISYNVIDSLTTNSELAERFWKAIRTRNLHEKWKLEVLTSLPVESIKKKHISRLYNTLKTIKVNFGIQFKRLKKYEKLDAEILINVLQIVVRRIDDNNIKIWLREEFFIQVVPLVEDIELLKKAYIQQDGLDNHFDYGGKCLLAVIQKDNRFLLEFIKVIFEKETHERAVNHKELSIVWELPNAEETLDEVVEYMASILDPYFISKHFVNAFFQSLTCNAERADKYLLSLIARYSEQTQIIRIVFDIIDTNRKALFEQAFRFYVLKNQDLESFKKIKWTGNQVVYQGNVIIGTIRAAKWEKLLKLVENMKLGTKTRAIRNHIKRHRRNELDYAEQEKRRKFLKDF
ncbi:hypothetical protein ADIWIN_3642 [Winogradskyella psychrotolerans RS-3]|uniref:Novel STAND NTPase 3 domain-containing protein n=1 Tax=Winogradskyella psychrotolerans RS-3 TaxID=641526 RepID=S7VK48_9FLAO|nr:ATP-binding protein [Winogradskyella psychrotolerans]EPR70286.1 hypothetical protein ADIWIN_3642 [Winogradskyella psychrotolerans RS-3]